MSTEAIRREHHGDLVILRIRLSAIDAVWAAAIEHACGEVSPLTALDFQEVKFINSAGISALLKFVVGMRSQGHTLVAINVRPHHRQIFKMAEIARFLPVVSEADLHASGT